MKPKKADKQQFRLPSYVIAAAALAIIAVVLVLVSSASTGLQSCSSKVLQQARSSCYTYYAHLYGNASICNSLSGQYRDECIYNVSASLSRASLCTGINSSDYEASCVSNISSATGNASACSILPEPHSSSCIYGVAKAGGFVSAQLCSSIQNSTLFSACSAAHYYDAAVATKNPGYCAYLSHAPSTAELDAMMSEAGAHFTALYAVYNATPFGYCYSAVAQELHDKSLCAALNGTDASLCLSGLTSQAAINVTQLHATCAQLASTNATIQYACNAGIAIYTAVQEKNVTICLGLIGSYSNTCIIDIASAYNDTSYCSYFGNATEANACNVTVRSGYVPG